MGHEPAQPLGLFAHDPPHQFVAVCRRISRPQGQQFVERQPQRVNVAPRITLALESFRRHVAHGADDIAGVGDVFGIGGLGQAEVGDPDVALGVEQEVGRLDVTVEHALAVGIFERLGDLESDAGHAAEEGAVGVRPGQRVY